MSIPPVVDYKRRSRIYREPETIFEFNMANLCYILLAISFVGLWIRASNIRKTRKNIHNNVNDPEPISS